MEYNEYIIVVIIAAAYFIAFWLGYYKGKNYKK